MSRVSYSSASCLSMILKYFFLVLAREARGVDEVRTDVLGRMGLIFIYVDIDVASRPLAQ